MNFLNITYFLAIAEEKNISAAARKLYISQQSLSEHLKKLEDELGTPLFRRGKTMTLTPAGECFLNGGKELLNTYNNLLIDIEDITKRRRSKLTIGIPTCCTPPYLSDLLAKYHEKYPQYDVSVVKRQHADIAHNMNGVDLYISYLPLSPELENCCLLASDPYCASFRRSLAEKVYGDRWEAVQRELLETRDLSLIKELPFVVLRDRYGQMFEDLRLIFQEYDFQPEIGFDSENMELNDQVCSNGLGCLLSAESYMNYRFFQGQRSRPDDLLSFPIRVDSFEPSLAVSYEKGKHLHAAEICFLKEARAFFEKY